MIHSERGVWVQALVINAGHVWVVEAFSFRFGALTSDRLVTTLFCLHLVSRFDMQGLDLARRKCETVRWRHRYIVSWMTTHWC